jgi:hypothetical protein
MGYLSLILRAVMPVLVFLITLLTGYVLVD